MCISKGKKKWVINYYTLLLIDKEVTREVTRFLYNLESRSWSNKESLMWLVVLEY